MVGVCCIILNFDQNTKINITVVLPIILTIKEIIRDSMMNSFNDPRACHQVHDAVYSIENISVKLMEDNILKETGFRVQISKD